MCIVYLDIIKAFNRFPHKRFLNTIKLSFIERQLLDLIEKWLWEQRVVLIGTPSNLVNVTSGVSQESALGPVLLV